MPRRAAEGSREDRFHKLFDSAADAIYLQSLEGRFLEVNREACERHGYSREQMRTMTPRDIMKPSRRESYPERLERVKSDGSAVFESVHLGADGREFPVEVNSRVIEFEGQRALLSVARDITERRRAESNLRFLEYSILNIPDPVYWADENARFIYVNEAACTMLGYSREELLSMSVGDVDLDVSPESWMLHWKSLKLGRPKSVETMHRTKEGRIFPVEVNLRLLSFEGRKFNCGVARDITERKRAENELRFRQEFERLVATLSTRFINLGTDEIGSGIADALHQIGEFLDVDHTYVFSFDSDLRRMRCLADWTREGVAVPRQRQQDMPTEPLPWWLAKMKAREIVNLSSLSGIPPDEKHMISLLRSQGIRSMVDIPIVHGDSLLGFLGIASIGSEKEFGDDRISLLRLVAELVANTLERRSMEEALRESRERLSLAVSSARLGMWDWFPEAGKVFFNERWAEMLGHIPDEIPPNYQSMDERLHPEDRPAVLRALQSHMEGHTAFYESEHRLRTKGGQYIWVYDQGRITERNEKGEPVRATGVTQDITQRKRAEEELQSSEARLSTVINHAPLILWALDREGRFTFSEGRGLKSLGLQPGEVVGLSVFDVYAESEQIIEDTRRAFAGESIRTKSHVQDKSFEVQYEPLFDENGEVSGVIGVGVDVTERTQLEALLRQSQKMEAVGQLAGGVAHDFNNILQAIRGYTELCVEQLDEGSEALAHLRVVMQASERAVTLIRQMLAFSRKERLHPERLLLDDVIHGLTKMLRRVIGEHIELEVRTRCADTRIYADPGQVEQVLMNLCVNARDAMPCGGRITIASRKVHLDAGFVEHKPWAREGDFVVLSVADSGEGIQPEIRDRIFEPFFTTKEIGEGTGLGLATVYAITRRHDGLIEMESEPGAGSVFRIYFPEAGAAREPEEPLAVTDQPPGGTETILLAEDDELVRGWTTEILEAVGYRVVTARDGQEAIDLFDKATDAIDLALLDVVMPKRSGREVYEAIRAKSESLPVLFTSGHSYRLLESGHLPETELHLLEKPYGAQELLRRLRELLGD